MENPESPVPIWTPDPVAAAESEIERFRRWVNARYGEELADYRALWRWSVSDLESFWVGVWDFFDVQSSSPYDAVLETDRMPGARWFTGARLNYAEHVLRHPPTDDPAVIEVHEAGNQNRLSWRELRRQTLALARTLREMGVRPGDRVAGYLPNCSAAIVAFLASASVGAVWSACGPDYSAAGATDRLGQLAPTLLIAADGYHHAGRVIDRREDVRALVDALPSLICCIEVPYVGLGRVPLPTTRVLSWQEATAGSAEPSFEQVPFDHPLWVLFTSGTTGKPKGIVHGHGGVLLEHVAQLGLQFEITARDRFFWYTTTNWMMWNLQVSALCLGATVLAYDGSPTYPDAGRMWEVVGEHGITVFGTSPGYLLASEKASLKPGTDHDLSGLRVLGSTGAPLGARSYFWVHDNVGAHVQLCSTSGGTDVVGSFMGGAATVPVYAGEISAPTLGVAMDAWSPEGTPLRDRMGELVVTRPIPSMPLCFWNDPDAKLYHEAYFATFPGVWRHGDWVTITSRGTIIIHGRSDATLNRNGVRLGSSDIYSAVEQFPEIAEAVVVGIEEPNGGYWMPMFVVLAPGSELTDELCSRINGHIRSSVSPRHVPDEIVAVPALPHTRTGKKVEVHVKRVLQLGMKAVDGAAVDDPTLLDMFAQIGTEHRARRQAVSQAEALPRLDSNQ